MYVSRRYARRRYIGRRTQRTSSQRKDFAGTPARSGIHDEIDRKVARGLPYAPAHPLASRFRFVSWLLQQPRFVLRLQVLVSGMINVRIGLRSNRIDLFIMLQQNLRAELAECINEVRVQ